MIQVVLLVAAIFAVAGLQLLRALLAKVFPTCSARPLADPVKPPAGYQDLYQSAHDDLTAIGLEGPHWFLRESDPPDPALGKLIATYRHPTDGSIFCLLPGSDPRQPNRLNEFAATRLADGRIAITQAYDPYFRVTATPDAPALTVSASTPRMHYEAHRGWLATFGVAADLRFTDVAAIQDFLGDWTRRTRDALLARGALRRDRDGMVRARFMFALRMLFAWLRRPKPPRSVAPIPAIRLAALAASLESIRERAPPSRVQWWLFFVSAALFAALGAFFWNLRLAILLLVVIAIHELGHYLAMRAFGYRNVHILALPLIGGVTMGHEVHPSAGKRAWMSLMGPLPGIVIGWTLLVLSSFGPAAAALPWLSEAGLMFLFINYLNVLPLPPLDGAKVVEAMLPPRLQNLQVAFIALTCIVGAVISAMIGWTLLTALAVLQLLTLPAMLANGSALKAMAKGEIPAASLPRAERLRFVLDLLERTAGPARLAMPRIRQAEAVLQAADQPPMPIWHRGLLALVMAGLLAVPVAVAMVYVSLGSSGVDMAKMSARVERMRSRHRHLMSSAAGMPLNALVYALAKPGTRPADEANRQAAAARVGGTLPTSITDIYQVTDGIDEVALAPLKDLRRATRDDLSGVASNGTVTIHLVDGSPVHVPLQRAVQWIRLSGKDQEDQMVVYYDDGTPPAVPENRVIEFDPESDGIAHADLRSLLESAWVSRREEALMKHRSEAAQHKARVQLRNASLVQLLDEFPQPNLLTRLLAHGSAWPGPATAAALAAVRQRLGVALPSDLVALYRQHDGWPPMQILPVAALDRGDLQPDGDGLPNNGQPMELEKIDVNGDRAGTLRTDAQTLRHCIVIAALRMPPSTQIPTAWWCPAAGNTPEQWISRYPPRAYPSFHLLLLDASARRRAAHSLLR